MRYRSKTESLGRCTMSSRTNPSRLPGQPRRWTDLRGCLRSRSQLANVDGRLGRFQGTVYRRHCSDGRRSFGDRCWRATQRICEQLRDRRPITEMGPQLSRVFEVCFRRVHHHASGRRARSRVRPRAQAIFHRTPGARLPALRDAQRDAERLSAARFPLTIRAERSPSGRPSESTSRILPGSALVLGPRLIQPRSALILGPATTAHDETGTNAAKVLLHDLLQWFVKLRVADVAMLVAMRAYVHANAQVCSVARGEPGRRRGHPSAVERRRARRRDAAATTARSSARNSAARRTDPLLVL